MATKVSRFYPLNDLERRKTGATSSPPYQQPEPDITHAKFALTDVMQIVSKAVDNFHSRSLLVFANTGLLNTAYVVFAGLNSTSDPSIGIPIAPGDKLVIQQPFDSSLAVYAGCAAGLTTNLSVMQALLPVAVGTLTQQPSLMP
jgi:hypothetical protein